MPTREEIQRQLEDKLHEGERALDRMKAKMTDAGEETTDEMKKAVEVAERALDKGKSKLERMASASDEAFDEMWAETKENWADMTESLGEHWDEISGKLRRFFS